MAVDIYVAAVARGRPKLQRSAIQGERKGSDLPALGRLDHLSACSLEELNARCATGVCKPVVQRKLDHELIACVLGKTHHSVITRRPCVNIPRSRRVAE